MLWDRWTVAGMLPTDVSVAACFRGLWGPRPDGMQLACQIPARLPVGLISASMSGIHGNGHG